MKTTIEVAPIKSAISFEILEKIDIRVGTIELVENVPGSDKLVKLVVNFGDHKRNIDLSASPHCSVFFFSC